MMNDNRRDRITNGRNGDHVSIINLNCQRRVLDRSCDFHAIKFGQEQETPMLDKSHTSPNVIHRVLGVETLNKTEFVLHLCCR